LNISGAVSVGRTTIDWLTLPGGGQFTVNPSSTGSFAGDIGNSGDAKNLDVTKQPVGVAFLLPNFLTLTGFSFDLNFIEPGIFPSTDCSSTATPGQVCTPNFPPPKSPFNLINTPTGAAVSLSVKGSVREDGGKPQGFVGIYTTQFVGMNFQTLLLTIQNGGTVNASYSANFTTSPAIPEPSTMYLTLSGLLLIGGAFARRILAIR
jgi:hypothetical protein